MHRSGSSYTTAPPASPGNDLTPILHARQMWVVAYDQRKQMDQSEADAMHTIACTDVRSPVFRLLAACSMVDCLDCTFNYKSLDRV